MFSEQRGEGHLAEIDEASFPSHSPTVGTWFRKYITVIFGVCVSAAVRRNRLTRDATDQEVEYCITKWLQNSGDREGGRRAREQRQLARYSNASCLETVVQKGLHNAL